MRFFAQANYPFLDWRRRGYLVSGVVLGLSIATMAFNAAARGSWVNYGVDFTGGTIVQLEFGQDVPVSRVRAAAAEGGLPVAQLSGFGSEREFLLRMTLDPAEGREPADWVTQVMSRAFPENEAQVVRTEAVGPQVGEELQQKAALAILVSFVLTLIYVAIRFEWRYGIATIAATAHDIVIALGIIGILWMEVSVGTVAALLTIVGYSLNDSIVVFDRAREILAKVRGKRDYRAALQDAINQTLPRTVLTSGTTLLTLSSLYLFGGAVIRDFALVLILGIGIGTFSSIFVGPPLLYLIEKKWPHDSESAPARRKKAGAVV